MVSGSLRLMGTRARVAVAALLVLPLVAVLTLGGDSPAGAAVALPSGFQQKVVFSGLNMPSNLAFSPDGRVFVTEKSGVIKVFDSLTDTTATVYADLRQQVNNYWDRGLLGLALHPRFPADPRVYVLYTYNGLIGGDYPKWPSANGGTDEDCPDPPGANTDGCVVSARLSVLSPAGSATTTRGGSGVRVRGAAGTAAAGTAAAGAVTEHVLVEDWCAQFPSHTVGTIAFGRDGMLYAGGGDGASFSFADYGQAKNPCGDPPAPAGTSLTAPSGQGGALRAQDLRTPGDPTGLDGGVIRVDPDTGDPAPGNPLGTTGADPNAKRLVAEGLRNPFRFTVRPGTNELWLGDVGWNTWEEIDRIADPTAKLTNLGWPCYEGAAKMPGYDAADLTVCENLYAAGSGAVSPPYYAYKHSVKVVANETCPTGSSSLSGLAFYPGGSYPAAYRNALFFTDYGRGCVWAMQTGTNGLPDPAKIKTFASGLAGLVELKAGPNGDLFGVDITGGKIVRFVYAGVNNPPVAAIKADPGFGALPLTVGFDASASSDVEGRPLTYRWDLDGDGQWDSGVTGPTASRTYTTRAKVTVKVEVNDGQGGVDTAQTVIAAGSTPPSLTIDSPRPGTTWKVGDRIDFAGHATDAEDGALPADRLSWSTVMQHCPANCHEHVISNTTGATGGFNAPDHEYPSSLELRLTATDSDGLTAAKSIRLDPRTADLTLATSPAGLRVGLADKSGPAPLTGTAIVGSAVSVSAPQPQLLADQVYEFVSWSDGGARTHNVTVPATGATHTATFRRKPNLALKRPVKVSSNRSSTQHTGPNAVDGSMSTRWLSGYTDTQWIEVDLGAAKRVGRVAIRWSKYFGKGYKIQTSTGGGTWTTVFTTTTGNGGFDSIAFTARDARWVRIYGTKRATEYGFSPWEFEVYDN